MTDQALKAGRTLGAGRVASGVAYRPDIDGLRAIAVLSVILFHARLGPFTGGFIGVDVFFVISGFLITSILKREIESGHFSLSGFYERRIRRVFPALFVSLLATAAIGYVVLFPVDTSRLGATMMAASGFGANIYFWRNTGYFSPDAGRNLLLHTWSLSVEEQFYIFFPMLLFLLMRFRNKTFVPIVLLAICIASLAIAQLELMKRPGTVFYLLPTRAWELLIGAVLSVAVLPKPGPKTGIAAGGAGLAMILASVIFYSPRMWFPGVAAVPPCLGAALLIYSGQRAGNGINSLLLGNAAMTFIGRISYSLYLWHWPLLIGPRIYLDRQLTMVETLALMALAIVMATLSWRYVETPLRRRGTPDFRWRVILIGLAGSAAFCTLGSVLVATKGAPWRYSNLVVAADRAQLREREPLSCVGPNAPSGPNRCLGRKFDILVWGDSHAEHFFPAIEKQIKPLGLVAQLQWDGGCPPVLDAEPVTLPPPSNVMTGSKFRREHECPTVNAAIMQLLRENPSVKAVVLAGAWSFWSEGIDIGTGESRYLTPKGSTNYSVVATRQLLQAGLDRTVAQVRALGLQVMLLGQVPDSPRSPSQCLAITYDRGGDPANCGQPRADALARLQWSDRILQQISAQRKTYLFEPATVLCKTARCAAELNGVPLYRDTDHMTAQGTRILSVFLDPNFFRAIRAAKTED